MACSLNCTKDGSPRASISNEISRPPPQCRFSTRPTFTLEPSFTPLKIFLNSWQKVSREAAQMSCSMLRSFGNWQRPVAKRNTQTASSCCRPIRTIEQSMMPWWPAALNCSCLTFPQSLSVISAPSQITLPSRKVFTMKSIVVTFWK